MITSLRGILAAKAPTEIEIDCNGVGYQVFIPLSTYDKLPELGTEIKLKIHFIPKEDAFYLYGFWEQIERDAFKLLISVNGIGPKIAIAILSSQDVKGLSSHIITGNILALQKLQGIGKKTAERLVLELKDKIIKLDIGDTGIVGIESDIVKREAILALMALGFSSQAAEKAVAGIKQVDDSELTVEAIIRHALKQTGR